MLKMITLAKAKDIVPRSLTMRSKLWLLAGFLIAIMVGSNSFMRVQVIESSAALGGQAELQQRVAAANAALRSFGELKYWLADLEVSWVIESEEKAEEARAALDEQLQAISAFAPYAVSHPARPINVRARATANIVVLLMVNCSSPRRCGTPGLPPGYPRHRVFFLLVTMVEKIRLICQSQKVFCPRQGPQAGGETVPFAAGGTWTGHDRGPLHSRWLMTGSSMDPGKGPAAGR